MRKLAATILALLSCCAVATAQVKPQADNSKMEIALPSESWTLVFDAPGFKVSTNGLQPDGRAYLMAENKSTGVTLSAYLERVSGGATVDGCKENQKQRSEQKVPYKRENLTIRESGGMTVLEFTIAEFNGAPVQQRNLFACMAKDDVYVDIHLSKVLFKASHEELFNAVLNSAHFVDKSSAN